MRKKIMVALVTPFNSDDKICEKSLKSLIDFNIKQGCSGFFVGGSSGEGPLLSFEERIELFSLVKQYSRDLVVIANVSSLSTKEAIKLSKHAKLLGYNYISSVIPYYYYNSMEEIADYFTDIIEKSNMEMIIYNFPKNSKILFDLNNDSIIKMLNHKLIFGLKHTNHDLYELEQIKRVNNNLVTYNGYDEIYLASLNHGVDGAIGSSFNFLTKKFIQIGDLFDENKIDEALKIQVECNKIMDVLVDVGLIAGIKYALMVIGFDCGIPRLPFKELTDINKSKIEKVLKETYWE